MSSSGEVKVISTIIPSEPSLREITRSKWSADAPSSIIFHPSMKSPERMQISGILIAIIIIIVAILIGLIIWIIYLVLNNSNQAPPPKDTETP